MKKFSRFFLLAITLLLIFQVPASAESLQDNLVPQDEEQKQVGDVKLDYNEYPQQNYSLDTYVDTSGDWLPWNWADGAGKQVYIGLMEIINSIWQLNVLLANFTMIIVQESFKLDFVSNVVDEIGSIVQNIAGFGSGGFMKNGLWPQLITLMICMVGAWATYVGIVKRETNRAWSGLISSLIVFVCALGYFSNASTILGGLNKWSSELQSNVLSISANIVNPGASYNKDEGIASVRNQMFDLMVKKPYLLMQYGSFDVDKKRVNDLLSLDPLKKKEDRQKKAEVEVSEKDNSMMSLNGISLRAAFVPLMFLSNSIIGTFLLLMSGLIILYQLIFLVLALFGPVPLLMAVVPRWQQTAVEWGSKVVHAQLMKIAIALLFTILFGVSAILYRATQTQELGYLGMMAIQIVCYVGIFVKRKELFNMVATATNNFQSSTGQSLQKYQQRIKQARSTIRKGKGWLDDKREGRLRNQPLTDRTKEEQRNRGKGEKQIGYLNKDQLAERKSQLKSTKEGLKNTLSGHTLTDRRQEELEEGQDKLQSRSGIENAPVDQEQLIDRRDGEKADRANMENTTVDQEQQLADRKKEGEEAQQNDNVTNINDLRRRRGNLANAPLTERSTLKDSNREAAASLDQSEKDVELSNREQTQRNINMLNHQKHEDNVNEEQNSQFVERRTLKNDTDREVSQDTINREQLSTNSNEKNISEVVKRNSISNDRNIHESSTQTENVSRNVTRRNEQTIRENREHVDVSRIIENVKKNDKSLTKWESEQLVKAKKNNDN
ncbi:MULTISPECIES: CD3337/EF1877 family mobilome membrane protein [Bacillus]|nr:MULTISPECIES: conjugal transfer protein [Bacillus]MEC1275281.1 conjugal transfer protein [Bacillus subtilis]MEC1318380.1 conjugal transfer protein [Bacillus subtilis]UEG59569.1 conjugal transfer protein [Bacillus sp. BC1-43]